MVYNASPLTALSPASIPFITKIVPTVDAKEFDPETHYYHLHDDVHDADYNIKQQEQNKSSIIKTYYETPVLIENALSQENCEYICDSLIEHMGDASVEVQRKTILDDGSSDFETQMYDCTLNQAFDVMMESHHDDSCFCFSEGLLNQRNKDGSGEEHSASNDILDDVNDMLTTVKEHFLGGRENREKPQNQDLFRYFPDNVKPSHCVILAGEGATSTLHRDPFSWTGTSLCLEGTKIWRFVAPPGAMRSMATSEGDSQVGSIDDLLEAYRLPSMVWSGDGKEQEDSLLLSAGWQSDFSLYASRDGDEEVLPSAEYFGKLEEEGVSVKYAKMKGIASNMDALRPSSALQKSDMDISIWTVVQKPGDLLVIPAFWWHQTYALEPSLAIASQRCGMKRDVPRVLNHILDMVLNSNNRLDSSNVPSSLKKSAFQKEDSPKKIVKELFNFLSRA